MVLLRQSRVTLLTIASHRIAPVGAVTVVADDGRTSACAEVRRYRLGGIVTGSGGLFVAVGPSPVGVQLGDAGDIITQLGGGFEAAEVEDDIGLTIKVARCGGVDTQVPFGGRTAVTAAADIVLIILRQGDGISVTDHTGDRSRSYAITVGCIGRSGGLHNPSAVTVVEIGVVNTDTVDTVGVGGRAVAMAIVTVAADSRVPSRRRAASNIGTIAVTIGGTTNACSWNVSGTRSIFRL